MSESCAIFERIELAQYVEGMLAAHRQRQLERHLLLCPVCRRRVAQMEEIILAMKEKVLVNDWIFDDPS